MFNTILIALDLSERGETVFSVGLDLAQKQGAQLHLLHVLSMDEQGSPTPPQSLGLSYYPGIDDPFLQAYQEAWEAFQQKGLNVLQDKAEIATQKGVKTEYSQLRGSPGKAICEVALNQKIDLIILGRRGLSGLSEWLMGSVSNYVLHHAPCSVLVVNE